VPRMIATLNETNVLRISAPSKLAIAFMGSNPCGAFVAGL
jgi:hypothetical protein